MVEALSRDGKYVLGSANDGSRSHALRFDVDQGILEIVEPEGAASCSGSAISGDGSIVIGRCGKTYAYSAGSARYFEGELADALVMQVSSHASVLVGIWPATPNWELGHAFRASNEGLA